MFSSTHRSQLLMHWFSFANSPISVCCWFVVAWHLLWDSWWTTGLLSVAFSQCSFQTWNKVVDGNVWTVWWLTRLAYSFVVMMANWLTGGNSLCSVGCGNGLLRLHCRSMGSAFDFQIVLSGTGACGGFTREWLRYFSWHLTARILILSPTWSVMCHHCHSLLRMS